KEVPFKSNRRFDRARDALVATAPHEVRLETRSVCTEAVVPPRLRGTGAPCLPIDRGTNTLRDCRDQALLAFCSGARQRSDFSSFNPAENPKHCGMIPPNPRGRISK